MATDLLEKPAKESTSSIPDNIFDDIPVDKSGPTASGEKSSIPDNIFDDIPKEKSSIPDDIFDDIPDKSGKPVFVSPVELPPAKEGERSIYEEPTFLQHTLIPESPLEKGFALNPRLGRVAPPGKVEAVVPETKNPLIAGPAEAIGETIKGLATPENLAYMLASMGVGATGAAGKLLVSAFWTAFMAHHAAQDVPQLATELGTILGKPEDQRTEEDKKNVTKILAQMGITTAFTLAPALHTGSELVAEKQALEGLAPQTARALSESVKASRKIQPGEPEPVAPLTRTALEMGGVPEPSAITADFLEQAKAESGTPAIAQTPAVEPAKPGETALKTGDRLPPVVRDEEGFAGNDQPQIQSALDSLPVGSQVVHRFTGDVYEKNSSGEWWHKPELEVTGNSNKDAGQSSTAGLAQAKVLRVGSGSAPPAEPVSPTQTASAEAAKEAEPVPAAQPETQTITEGVKNAPTERIEQVGNLQEHPGVPSRENVQSDTGEVRQEASGQAGGGGGNVGGGVEPEPKTEQAPAPAPRNEPNAEVRDAHAEIDRVLGLTPEQFGAEFGKDKPGGDAQVAAEKLGDASKDPDSIEKLKTAKAQSEAETADLKSKAKTEPEINQYMASAQKVQFFSEALKRAEAKPEAAPEPKPAVKSKAEATAEPPIKTKFGEVTSNEIETMLQASAFDSPLANSILNKMRGGKFHLTVEEAAYLRDSMLKDADRVSEGVSKTAGRNFEKGAAKLSELIKKAQPKPETEKGVSASKVAEAIATGKVEPFDSLEQGEVHDRVKQIQKDFAEDPNFKRVLELSIKLKRGTISDAEITELFQSKESTRVSAGYLADLVNPKSLEKIGSIKWRNTATKQETVPGSAKAEATKPELKPETKPEAAPAPAAKTEAAPEEEPQTSLGKAITDFLKTKPENEPITWMSRHGIVYSLKKSGDKWSVTSYRKNKDTGNYNKTKTELFDSRELAVKKYANQGALNPLDKSALAEALEGKKTVPAVEPEKPKPAPLITGSKTKIETVTDATKEVNRIGGLTRAEFDKDFADDKLSSAERIGQILQGDETGISALRTGKQVAEAALKSLTKRKGYPPALELLSDKIKWFDKALEKAETKEFVGMGGAVPSEFESSGGAPTSMKMKQIDAERVARGLEPLTKPESVSDQITWGKALSAIDQDPQLPDKLVAELLDKPRVVSDVESHILLAHKIALRDAYNKSAREAIQAYEDSQKYPGRLKDMEEANVRTSAWMDKLDEVERASRASGSERGRALRALQVMANEDMSLASLEQQVMAARLPEGKTEHLLGGARKPLISAEERAGLQKIADDYKAKNEKLQKALAAKEKKNAELRLKNAIEQTAREAAQAKAAEIKPAPEIHPSILKITEDLVKKLDTRADAARARIKARLIRTHIAVDPTVLVDLAEIGASYLGHKVLDFAKWSAKMTADLGAWVKPYLKDVYSASQKHIEELSTSYPEKGKIQPVRQSLKGVSTEKFQDEIAKSIKRKVDDGKMGSVTRYVQKLAAHFWEQGIRDRHEMVDALHKVLEKAIPGITKAETTDAFSGYGRFKQLSKKEVDVGLRAQRGELQQERKLEDMKAGKAPKRSGVEQRTKSDEERRLEVEVEAAKRRGGYTVTDPATQLKTAQQAIKTRLTHEISDLDYQIENKVRIVKDKTKPATDTEIENLKTVRDEKRKLLDEVVPKKPISDEQLVKVAIKATERSLAEYEKRIREGDVSPLTKPAVTPLTPELEAVRERRDAAREQLQELRDIDAGYKQKQELTNLERQRNALLKSIEEKEKKLAEGNIETSKAEVGRPADPQLEELMQKRDELNKRIAEARKRPAAEKYADKLQKDLERLQEAIADRESRIASGNFEPTGSKKVVSRPLHPELEIARQRLSELNKEIADKRNPPKSASERANQAYRTRLTNQIADLQERLLNKDYAPVQRTPTVYDPETLHLQAERDRVSAKFRREVELDRIARRSGFERGSDWIVRWRRGFILSSPVTLAKLTTAAIQRMAITPIEEAIGVPISQLFPSIASKAAREGGINGRAEAKAITEAMTQGMKDAWDVLRTGQSDLDILYGKEILQPPSVIDFFGRVHGFLKAPVKRAEFARSLEKRTRAAIAQGVDVTDEAVKSGLFIQSYLDASRAIFLQDNRFVTWYKRMVKGWEAKDPTTGTVPLYGKTAATTARILLPIVKVPVNIVAETIQYATGSVTGSLRLARAFHNGVENLKPEEADLIMRSLKKGSLGAAAILIGYFNSDSIGGYYQKGEKRKKGDVKAGNIDLFGINLPSYMLHNPLLETVQIGATIRRVMDSKLRKKDTEKQGLGPAIVASALGLTEEVPFVRETAEMLKAFNPHERGQFLGELAKSLIIPQFVQWAARLSDQKEVDEENIWDTISNALSPEAIPRKTESITDYLKSGVPGLRQELPKKKVKK